MSAAFFLDFFSGSDPDAVCGGLIRHTCMDFRGLAGTRGYCDAEAAREIRHRLEDVPADALHFFDSGNCHYLTLFFLEKLKTPFRLAVFDHHNDMREPLFPGILSCGGWVLRALETLPLLQDVLLIGLGDEQCRELGQLPAELRDRVRAWDETSFRAASFQEETRTGPPVYCSIDKDVLSPDVLTVDWDQGTLLPEEIAVCLPLLVSRTGLAGMDVCGGTGAAEADPRGAAVDRSFLELYLRLIRQTPPSSRQDETSKSAGTPA